MPTLSDIQKHFCRAKQVRCLKTGLAINIEHNPGFEFKDNAYTSIGGAVVFWKEGQYAEILNKHKKPCEECKKKKTLV